MNTLPRLASDDLKGLGLIGLLIVGIVYAVSPMKGNERKNAMMKTIEVMGEAIRNQRHPFRKTQHHSKKSLKNRHERRKIKEYLHLGDWLSEEMA